MCTVFSLMLLRANLLKIKPVRFKSYTMIQHNLYDVPLNINYVGNHLSGKTASYSVSAVPCHLLSKYRIKLKRPRLRIMRISTENSSQVLVVVVLMISAPMKNSKLNVK
jgi:flagellar assembly factor FliW